MCTPLIRLTSWSMMNEVHALHSLAALKPMEGYSSFGRPAIVLPPNTSEIINDYLLHKINNIDAAKKIGITRGTFFRMLKNYRQIETVDHHIN